VKRVLLLFSEVSVLEGYTHPKDLASLLQSASDQLGVYTCLLEDLVFSITSDFVDVLDTANDCSLADYDVVYFRYWGQTQGHAIAAARFCKLKGVPFVDSEVLRVGSQNKITQYMNLYEAGVAIPHTLIGKAAHLTALYERFDFTFPFILKATNGTRGKDNYLVHDRNHMQQIFTDNPTLTFVLQEFLPNNGDYRVVVMGDKVVLVIERKANQGTHLNNTSQGGDASIVPVDSLPEEVLKMSVRAAQFFGRQIAGVDIVQSTSDGKYYCFEVNRAPQIEHATFETEKARLLADYLAKL